MKGHWTRARALVLMLALAAATVAPGAARAEEGTAQDANATRVYGSTSTFFTVRQVLDPKDPASRLYQFPIYEYLTLGSDNTGVPGFSIQLSGVGRLQAGHVGEDRRFDGDLLLGTVAYTMPNRKFSIKLGRQFLMTGAGNGLVMDGGWFRARPGKDVEIEAFGGWVPWSEFDYDFHRVVFGARVAYNPWDWGRIGVSYVGERANVEGGDTGWARSNLGFDYAFRWWRPMELSGWLTVDMVRGSIQETENTVAFFPTREWTVSLDYGMHDPAARIPRTSIFSVFTSSFYHKVGAEVAYRSRGWLSANLYGRFYRYGEGDNGYELGFKPQLRFGRRTAADSAAGLEVARLKGFSNAYTLARAFGRWVPIPRMDIVLDVQNYFYDDAINGWEAWRRARPDADSPYVYSSSGGYKRSHVVQASVGGEVFENARLQGDLVVTVNPDFTQQYSGLVKFVYAFSTYVK